MPDDYPLTVAFLGGPYRHNARWAPDGNTVETACVQRGEPTSNGSGRPWCPDCTTPTSQETTR
ncbi:hypothetical protein ACTWP5_27465 [Streptomyces sp. 4N509B]|uniref:hypothetical protein n=1 Tax=Streptomyces sp. 4N509B TaxID=3457413 RepID=UPI003FCFBE8E